MKLNIFWRMAIGFLIAVLLVVIISSHSIYKLTQLNRITNSILTIDQPSIETEKKMIDSLLSQVRNEQKYLITKDKAFYELFQSHKAEFIAYLNQLNILLDSSEENILKNKVKDLYFLYIQFIEKDINSLNNDSFSENQYEREKNTIIDRITRSIDKLVVFSQSTINNKVKYSREIGGRAALVAESMAIISLILGILLSFYITRSINNPLKKLEAQTRNIADGKFDSKIEISSPIELSKLANSFNQMCDELRKLDEMKSGFISHISHELRTPLTSINEANNLLIDEIAGKITEKQKRLLEIIKQDSNKLIKLINELLDLSKMEAGMMDYNLVKVDIPKLIEQCISDIKLLTKKKNIQILSSLERSIPLIEIDIDKIQQVINNLLSNAAKFTPEKGIINVNAKLVKINKYNNKFKDGLFLQVSISDTGVGIPQGYLNKVFDRFQQINPTLNSSIKGTGLGLSITKHIIEAHKGKIWVKSQLGKGSTFTFILPVNEKTTTDYIGNKMEKKL